MSIHWCLNTEEPSFSKVLPVRSVMRELRSGKVNGKLISIVVNLVRKD